MATSGPGALHLLTSLYDARMDHADGAAWQEVTATSATRLNV
ncbi:MULTISPECIES: hypothetical protein [Pseudomonas]|nr:MULTISPECIES: hypothetical protein [Pseudomonas]